MNPSYYFYHYCTPFSMIICHYLLSYSRIKYKLIFMKHQIIKNNTKNIIRLITPHNKIEERDIEDATAWISSGEEIFRIKKDAIPKKHLVSYCVVVDIENKKVLLLDHKKALLLLPSGGHINKNEMPHKAAQRELKEELNLDLKIISNDERIPFFITITDTVGISESHTDVSLWYLFKWDLGKKIDTENINFKKEFNDFYWFSFNEVLNLPIKRLDKHMHRFINKLKQNL